MLKVVKYIGWAIYRSKFEPSLMSNLAILMYVTKFSILSPLNVMNRFTLGQHWNLWEMLFQNKNNWLDIFCEKIFISGEAHDHLSECINNKNCRICGL